MTTNTIAGDIIHQWNIKEYENHERPTRWFVIMGVLGSLLIFFALVTGNFLFALIIMLFGIIIFLQSNQAPKTVPIKITDLGIIIGTRFYMHTEIAAFYIVYNPPQVMSLFLETKGLFKPRIQIDLLDEDPNEIRDTLLQFIEEDLEVEQEPLSDKVAREWMIH